MNLGIYTGGSSEDSTFMKFKNKLTHPSAVTEMKTVLPLEVVGSDLGVGTLEDTSCGNRSVL